MHSILRRPILSVLLVLLSAPAPATARTTAEWKPAPIPQGARGYEHGVGYLIDAAAGGASEKELAAAWKRHGPASMKLCRGVTRYTVEGDRGHGSWNHGVNGCAGWAAATGSQEPVRILAEYARAQLTPPPRGHGLGGREVMSHRYLDGVLAALELTASHAEAAEDRTAIHRLLRAHAYTLALWAVPGGPGGRLTIVSPGARSKRSTAENPWLSAWLAGAIYGERRPELGWRRQWAWPLRVAWSLSANPWLDDADRELLQSHVAAGDQAPAIVRELRELGASTVVTVQVERRSDGIAGWFESNPHNASAPLMATSYLGDTLHALHLHPAPEDSSGGRRLGDCTAELSSGRLEASCRRTRGFAAPPPKGVRLERQSDTYSGEIPAPRGKLLYRVSLGPDGPRVH